MARRKGNVEVVGAVALGTAEEALAALAKIDPKLRRWLESGAPPIRSEDEHIRWFGETYATYADRMTAGRRKARR